ncbi:MAG: cytochrome oxidase subunit III [Acidobacteria bacterium]|nr:cytochrome oxidase subunit III [Acidobacteriota bacterium]
MSAHAHAEHVTLAGRPMLGVGLKKLGMWLFLISDALTFATLLICYSYLRIANEWPHAFEFSPGILFSSLMTLILLSSSLTMVFGVAAAHDGDRNAARLWTLLTALGGAAFVGLHLTEWNHLIHEGVTPFENPWGVPLFGGFFFLITGLHMTHVVIGVGYLLVVALGFGGGKFAAEDVEVAGLYWHFVDLVWMFVFPLIYLLSVAPGS